MQNQIFIRLILALFFIAGSLVKSYTQPPCALPAPETLTVTAITPTSISLAWTPPPISPTYIVVYKVSCFDETDQVALPDEYTTLLTHTRSGLQPGHFYRIGVSASQCNNEYGPEIRVHARTSIFIIDDIVQNSCAPYNSINRMPNDTMQVVLAPGVVENEPVQVVRLKVNDGNNWIVEYTIWADCNGTPHYRALSETNVSRTPPSDDEPIQTQGISYYNASNPNQMLLGISKTSSAISGGQLVTTMTVSFKDTCTSSSCSWVFGTYHCPKPPERGMGFGGRFSVAEREMPELRSTAPLTLSVTPNPASDAISVEYTLPSEGPAIFSLFDVRGQKIKTFDSPGVLQPGLYNTVFQLDELPAGMYFLALQTATERRIISLVKQ